MLRQLDLWIFVFTIRVLVDSTQREQNPFDKYCIWTKIQNLKLYFKISVLFARDSLLLSAFTIVFSVILKRMTVKEGPAPRVISTIVTFSMRSGIGQFLFLEDSSAKVKSLFSDWSVKSSFFRISRQLKVKKMALKFLTTLKRNKEMDKIGLFLPIF